MGTELNEYDKGYLLSPMLQILHFSLHVSFISHDSEAISKYNTVQSGHEELHLSDLLFIPYNVKNPFSSLLIDFNTRLLHQSILGGLVVGNTQIQVLNLKPIAPC